jgi:CubicO group peptidase (beta-lactamase class C family)
MGRDLSRREILITMGAAMGSTGATPFTWVPISERDAGVAAALGDRIDAAQRKGELPGLHGVLLARRGRLVLERYYPGADHSWGRPLGLVAFGADTLHDLRSVTKSLVGLLYGIALAEGKVAAPDAVLVDQFPEYPDLAAEPSRRRLTVAHALTMTMGLEWNEQLPYTSPANAEIAMERAPDRYRFVLERPFAKRPAPAGATTAGRRPYSGGSSRAASARRCPTMPTPRCCGRSASPASSGSGVATGPRRPHRDCGSRRATSCGSAS